MNMNCERKFTTSMYRWIDERIEPLEKMELLQHLRTCGECKKKFKEVKKIDQLLTYPPIKAPNNFNLNVVRRLPKTTTMRRWFKRHPFLTVSGVLVIFMSSALYAERESYKHQRLMFSTRVHRLK